MATPVAVTRFAAKSHSTPDETRTPEKTRAEIVQLEGFALGRFTFEPGWQWSQCIKPVVKTDSCQVHHVGYAISGRLVVRLQDGSLHSITGGQSFTIPPGHDAWVEGDEPFVDLEVMNADQYIRQ